MSHAARGVLLTGATGLLGRYLLRDLLLAGDPVAVLVRDAPGTPAAGRVRELIDFWSDATGRLLPDPVILCGDVRSEGLGLTAGDRRWLAANCHAVVHSAASLAFRASADGEPWATNVEGTRHVLNLCRECAVAELHHVSTAFVCGEAPGRVLEDDRRSVRWYRNVYEHSKWEAEGLVRQATDVRATVYRPSVIVGDSRTGYTSTYHGIYRFLRLADRLAEPARGQKAPDGRRRLDLRLPLTGHESHNLVPVDWVSGAIVRLMNRPEWHGHTFHLVSPQPVSGRLVKEVAETVLGVEGVQFADRRDVSDSTVLEQLFLDRLEEYTPYLDSDPQFDASNLRKALPDLPPVPIDRLLLTRLFEFAVNDQWGTRRGVRAAPAVPSSRIDCREYVEEVFPQAARRSPLARAARLDVVVAIDVRGPGGGQWTCAWVDGDLILVEPGMERRADVVYRTDPVTFDNVVRGRSSPQEAFFARRVEIGGDVEKGLKLAVLFGLFLAEAGRALPARQEATNGVTGSV
jgi:thioester reductase-like protein